MPISRLTALIIQSRDDIVCTFDGPGKDGKFMGWISIDEKDRFRPLINSEAVYNSGEEAKAAMEKIVEEIRAIK